MLRLVRINQGLISLSLVIILTVLTINYSNAKETINTPFLAAASENDVTVIRQMLAQGVDIETRDQRGRSALLIATHHGAINAARVLIEAGANVNAMDGISDSPYLYAGADGPLEILLMTLDAGADLASVNRYGGTALIPAAHHGHVDIVRALLKTEINIDHINDLGWTALLEAVILGDGGPVYIEIVGLLIDAGADATITDNDNVSPLEHATSSNYVEIVRLLSKTVEILKD